MLTTFGRFQSALSLSGTKIDPYQISHPVPRERIANLESLAQASPYFNTQDSPTLQERHDLMRAKIAVFTQGAEGASRLFRSSGAVWRPPMRKQSRPTSTAIRAPPSPRPTR